ncbi:MAG: RNA polymerase sigma factor [Clostridium sp.]|nr:RNA polymerase sigma factor [Clostridium sp.]
MILLLTFSTQQEQNKFENLFHKYKKLLLHHALGILKDYALAEDAVSEAYIRIYKNMHKIEEIDSPRTVAFLVTIARNVSLTMLAREKKSYTEEISEEQGDGFDLEESVLTRISTTRVQELLHQMREELRDVFILKYAYDLSHREIADTLGISENNVTVRLYRAKKALAATLRKEGYCNE